jgi:acetyltransferase-like isoleucine patch superfamily enzyme
MTVLVYLSRLAPAIGWLTNAIRHRGLHCGLGVEIFGDGRLIYGKNVSIGQNTRIDLPSKGLVEIGDNVSISRGVHIVAEVGRRISFGDQTTVQDGCRIYGNVVIGRRCIFAPNVFVSSGTHAFDTLPHRPIQEQDQLAPIACAPIRIFGDCWFGINAVILRGVTIGRGCVVGANAVVNTDLPPYSVAVGNPVRIVKQRLPFVPKSRIDVADEADWPYFYDGFDLSLAANESEFVAISDFVLAMHHPRPRAIRLCLRAESGDIGFAGHRQHLPRQLGVLEFELGTELLDLPFLRFQVNGHARIRWAELV